MLLTVRDRSTRWIVAMHVCVWGGGRGLSGGSGDNSGTYVALTQFPCIHECPGRCNWGWRPDSAGLSCIKDSCGNDPVSFVPCHLLAHCRTVHAEQLDRSKLTPDVLCPSPHFRSTLCVRRSSRQGCATIRAILAGMQAREFMQLVVIEIVLRTTAPWVRCARAQLCDAPGRAWAARDYSHTGCARDHPLSALLVQLRRATVGPTQSGSLGAVLALARQD